MCGIVGYIGQQQALPFLLDGLSHLEYRGYDSAGVAVLNDGTLTVVKSKGRLTELQARLDRYPLRGSVGIGHTRWATHGAPSDENAHPHISESGRYAVVHNGIIENYVALKDELMKNGVTFRSETDTEVVAQLLDTCTDLDLLSAVHRVIARLEGSFALAVLDRNAPDTIAVARQDSPLVVGFGKDGYYLASDIPALLPYTRIVSFMEDGETALLTPDGVTFYRDQTPFEKEKISIDWDMDAAEMGGYAHFMAKEMHEEPSVLKKTLRRGRFRFDTRPDDIHIVACGSAYHVGMIGKYVIEKLAHIPVFVDIASEYRYRDPIITENTLVTVISQSGETADTLAALREAKRRGAKVLGIVNVVGSTIARESDEVFYTSAGPEIAVATTKAYSAQLLAIYRMALALAGMDETDLADLPEKVAEVLKKSTETHAAAKRFFDAHSIFYIGRGVDYALAMEGSLKLKEISYIHSEAYGAGELKHGTISLIEEGSPVIALCTDRSLLPKMVGNIREVQSRGAVVIAVTQEGCEAELSMADILWTIPKTNDLFGSLPAVTLLQLFAYFVALEKGCDIDKPRNLAKSVTVE
ncbi:MAG: glutamine--fructose-6-phosphate transaminase (isomerizing) [Clostridia bacterium]|nr:glutamine--fructose-6-phosphate transaminase (isomerizing) [Clostridia bacterium]